MHRRDILLAALAHGSAQRAFRPVHVQKVMFLLDRKAPDLFDDNSRFHFTPYDYGPFDSSIYSELELLERNGDVEIDRESEYGYRLYSATDQGIEKGRRLLESMEPNHHTMVAKVVDVLLPLDFRQLVSAIYRAYPDMKVNSVFKS